MKNIKIFSLFLVIFLAACNIDRPCKDSNLVCPDWFESTFRIVSKSDGRDLVFGPRSIYDYSTIRVFSLKLGDTTFADFKADRLVLNGYDSIMRFKILSKADTLHIELSSSDIDTIKVSYGQSQGRCCSFNSIRTLNYNNSGALPNCNGTVEFKK